MKKNESMVAIFRMAVIGLATILIVEIMTTGNKNNCRD